MEKLAFVIEDHPDISVLFLRAVVEAGFRTIIIRNGKEALARLGKEAPSLVVLDMHLPDANGGTILDFIRKQEHLAQTKVIVATADAQMSDQHQHKADLCLQKPVTFSQMRTFAQRYKN